VKHENDKRTIQKLHERNDKTFILLSGLYDWLNLHHPELIAALPYTLNAQILYVFGEIDYNEVTTWDDSVVTIFASELEALHETCIITECSVCDSLARYEEWKQTR
jgi:hypothetical protein